jgi:hypothetical protein
MLHFSDISTVYNQKLASQYLQAELKQIRKFEI